MKNIMDTYLNFTEKKIKKYMRMIFGKYNNEEIVSEYLKTYINARYYNIKNTDKPARAFYLRIIDELNYKEISILKKIEAQSQDLQEKQEMVKFSENVKEVFSYILFFDNVRNIENFKNVDSIKEIVRKIMQIVTSEYKIKTSKDYEETLYKEITSDMLEKNIFLDKFDTDEFMLSFENIGEEEDIYFAKLEHNVRMPIQYSAVAIEKVFSEGIVAEDKLQVEYMLLSLISMRDIINGNFKDVYVAEFADTLFKKKTKMDGILSLISNQALQDKISINITYSDYTKYKKTILEYTNKGYNFVITLDNSIKSVEDVEKLKMFKIVIAPQSLVLYREWKQNKAILNNVIYK